MVFIPVTNLKLGSHVQHLLQIIMICIFFKIKTCFIRNNLSLELCCATHLFLDILDFYYSDIDFNGFLLCFWVLEGQGSFLTNVITYTQNFMEKYELCATLLNVPWSKQTSFLGYILQGTFKPPAQWMGIIVETQVWVGKILKRASLKDGSNLYQKL